jgi:hypothetical protein
MDPSKNKRRAQWRVNDINKAAKTLYAIVEHKRIEPAVSFTKNKRAA